MEQLEESINSTNISADSLDGIDLQLMCTESDERNGGIFNDVLSLYLKHNLTMNCLEDICKLVNRIPGATINIPSTKFNIFKRIQNNSSHDIVKVYYIKCVICQCYRQEGICSGCKSELRPGEVDFFAYIPIENQLKQSIEKNWSNIVNFEAHNGDNGCISDAHSAKILRQLYKTYENSDGNVISLSIHIYTCLDGNQ